MTHYMYAESNLGLHRMSDENDAGLIWVHMNVYQFRTIF